MRIAIVCCSFDPNRSYQENIWAEQLLKAGHTVRVIGAGRTTAAPAVIESPIGPYEVQQVRTWQLPRSIYLTRDAAAAVRSFSPDLIAIFGDKLFARGVTDEPQLAHVPVISTYSENTAMHEFDWRKAGIGFKQRLHAIGFAVIRGGAIRANCRRSDIIVGNTPQGRDIVLRLFRDQGERDRINAKIIDRPLGFSPDHFGHDPQLRQSVRRSLGIGPDEVVVCTSSRFDPDKADSIRLVIDACRRLMPQHPSLRAMIVGFSDTPTTAEIRRHLDSGPYLDRFIQQPFANRQRMNELFNAADIVVYNRPTISCQEALGTGLYACFADGGTMNHLVTSDEQGAFYRPLDVNHLTEVLTSAITRFEQLSGEARQAFRSRLAAEAQWLRYDRIIESVFEELRKRLPQQAAEAFDAALAGSP